MSKVRAHSVLEFMSTELMHVGTGKNGTKAITATGCSAQPSLVGPWELPLRYPSGILGFFVVLVGCLGKRFAGGVTHA